MRTKKSFLNIISEIIPQILLAILGFYKIKVFIDLYGDTFNGFNQTISQLVAYLSLVEGGFGVSIMQSLYKPLYEKNYKKVGEIIVGARTVFCIFGCIAFVISLFLIPNLLYISNNIMAKGKSIAVYLCLILPTILSYFLLAPSLVLIADQKRYIVNLINKSFSIIRIIIQILFIWNKFDYLFLVAVDCILFIMQHTAVMLFSYKLCPYLKLSYTPDYSSLKNMKYVLVHNLSSTVKYNTDNIILANRFPGQIGLSLASIYVSYNNIIKLMIDTLSGALTSIKDSFGNLLSEDKSKVYTTFLEYQSISFFIASIIACVTFVTIQDFIFLWIQKDYYILSNLSCFLFSFILFESVIRIPIHSIRDVAGLFKESTLFPVSEAAINIFLSILLVTQFKITGILLATVISSIVAGFILNPKLVYNKVFHLSLRHYYKDTIIYYISLLVILVITKYLWNTYFFIYINNLLGWGIFACLETIIAFILSGLIYIKFDKNFQYLMLKRIPTFLKNR